MQTLSKIEEAFLGLALLGLAVLTFAETGLRYAFSYTFTWFQEFSNYMIVFTTFLGASIGTKYTVHFSMDAIPQAVPDRIAHLMKSVAYLLSGAVVCLFVYFGMVHLLKLRGFGVKSAAMQIPMFIPYIPIPLFSLTMAFRFFALFLKHGRSFIKNEPFERIRGKNQ